ncbi:hypothetical protein CRG98_042712 [Punica granatum]|uniref:Uncharacterized protein n=1 Tax=Punica granatum TaxID=22663 RepID=A0A2I0HYY1_PUNGR|nr:hypothetical protein CRG98_042712 [Punica granatum]
MPSNVTNGVCFFFFLLLLLLLHLCLPSSSFTSAFSSSFLSFDFSTDYVCKPGWPPLTSCILFTIFLRSLVGSYIFGGFKHGKLALKSLSGQAKVGGTVASIAGALIITFYKGHPLTVSTTLKLHLPSHSSWVLVGFFVAGEALMISSSYILQAFILRDYPVVLIIMFHINLFGTIFAALLSLIAVRDPELCALKVDSSQLQSFTERY